MKLKFSYGDIQKYMEICFQSASRMEFLGVKKWCSATVFSDTKQNMFAGKFSKVFRCFAGAYYFQYQVSLGS